MVRGETHLSFCQIDDIVRDIVPVFGAHPLSQVVSQRPILLVEGGDDVRIWQQAVRSSEGCMALHPCACGSVDRLNAYEQASVQILDSVYDDPRAFSLRDRDGVVEDIDDSLPLIRMRLACRNAENLILTDEVLGVLGTDWDAFRSRLNMWIDRERGVTEECRHRYFNAATRFAEDCDRKCADIKQCRTLFVGEIACSNMPWEVAVGKAIAGYAKRGTGRTDAGSLGDFLGEKVMLNLVPRQPQRDE
jgi:hypothetical protein